MQSDSKDDDSQSFRARQVTSKMQLVLRGDEKHLTDNLFAINWFDTSPAWVYHLYNSLALGRLKKAGGKALFKGRILRRLSGDESLARQHLLIVNYPSADHFLNLVSDKLFQVISLLRMLSVRRFSFVMHERIDSATNTVEPSEPSTFHAVLHFHSNTPESVVRQVETAATAASARVVFSGHEAVHVHSESGDTKNAMDYVTPNTIVFAAASENDLDSCFQSNEMQDALKQTDKHFAGLLKRSV